MSNEDLLTEQELLTEEFFTAIKSGDEEKLLEVLNKDVNINSTTISGNNAIYLACDRRRPGILEILLNYTSIKGEKINIDHQNNNGSTTLLELVKSGNFIRYIEVLINYGANVNIPDKNNMTALIKAAADEKEEELDLILNAKNVNVNYVIEDTKTTAFLMSCVHSNFNIVKKLVDKGADTEVLDFNGKNGLINALFKSTQDMKKKQKENHKFLCLYLASITKNLNYIAPSGMSAFWIASATKQEEVCDFLIEKKVDVNVSHELGLDGKMTAFHLWCQSGKPEIVTKLFNAGAKLGIKDSNGNTPDTYGFINSKLRQTMLNINADVNSIFVTKEEKMPVFTTIISNGDKQIEIIKEMIKRNVNVTYNNEMKKFEPLYIAMASSAKLIVNELLETNKIDVNQIVKFSEDAEGITPLGFLFSGIKNSNLTATIQQQKYYESLLKAKEINDKNGIVSNKLNDSDIEEIKKEVEKFSKLEENIEANKIDIFKNLLRNGLKFNIENEEGNTEIFFAKKSEDLDFLVKNGSNLFHKNKLNHDLLYHSIIRGQTNLIPYLKEKFEEANHPTSNNLFYQLAFEEIKNGNIQEFIHSGVLAYINYSDKEVKKSFHKKDDDLETKSLNIKGINYQDEDGNSPILIACASGIGSTISLFLNLGADINLKNNLGETPIMHALNSENLEIIKYLIKKGADINVENNEGVSLWDMAKELGNINILNELKKEFDLKDELKIKKKTI